MLPVRDGVGPSQVGLPPGPWPRMLDFLVHRFPAVAVAEWRRRMDAGEVIDQAGRAIGAQQAYAPHGKLYYYRTVPDEPANTAQATVLFEDECIVAADKPHFLPVTPSGHYLQETLLVRLRRQLGLPGLTPLHRIDRETAGVVLFAKTPALCAGYESLFARRQVAKQYQAIAAAPGALRFPLSRTSVLVPDTHFMQMREAEAADRASAGEARTDIEWMESQGAWARYRLKPLTGRRHQLRVHMAALGLPILGDRIYPRLHPPGGDDLANPLRLLAERIAFRDPVTGQAREFVSARQLDFP
jgi:tRNA pseudouridine32 synthase/23S rRNA pseudouridine746 synthase